MRGCTQFCKHLERAHIMFPSQRVRGARTLITQTQGYADENQDGVLRGLMIPSKKGEYSSVGGGILDTQTIRFWVFSPGDLFLQFYLGIIHVNSTAKSKQYNLMSFEIGIHHKPSTPPSR